MIAEGALKCYEALVERPIRRAVGGNMIKEARREIGDELLYRLCVSTTRMPLRVASILTL